MDRVALTYPPGRPRAADPRRIVQRQHRLQPGQARRHQLGTAGEPGEEVRFHEAGGDAHVRAHPVPVEPHRYPVAVHTAPHQRARIPGVVVDDPHRSTSSSPNMARSSASVLARCVPVATSTVRSRRVQHPVELIEQRSQHRLARLRPGHVADADGDPLAGSHDVAQRRAGHRSAQRVAQHPGRIAAAAGCAGATTVVRAAEVHRQAGAAVGQPDRCGRVRHPAPPQLLRDVTLGPIQLASLTGMPGSPGRGDVVDLARRWLECRRDTSSQPVRLSDSSSSGTAGRRGGGRTGRADRHRDRSPRANCCRPKVRSASTSASAARSSANRSSDWRRRVSSSWPRAGERRWPAPVPGTCSTRSCCPRSSTTTRPWASWTS